MMKLYLINGKQWQFEEGEQPDGAVEVVETKAVEPSNKAVKPANKTRKAARK